jgi:hypothetical protein
MMLVGVCVYLNGAVSMNSQIFLIGTNHCSKKSKKIVFETINNINPNIIFLEGIGKPKRNDFLKEPIISTFLPFWFWIVELCRGKSEFELAKEIAQKKKILFKNIDVSFSDLINQFHKKYNYFIILIPFIFNHVFFIFFKLETFTIYYLKFLFGLIVFFIFAYCFAYFVPKTNKIRNKNFVNNIINIKQSKKYSKILVVCGENHVKKIKTKVKSIVLS